MRLGVILVKSKGRFAKSLIIFSITFIVLYTVVNVALTYATGIPEPSTLTNCVFLYFSIESVLLMIKKLKGGKDYEREDVDDSNDIECGGVTDEPSGTGDQGDAVLEQDPDELRSVSRSSTYREPWYIRIFRRN